MQQATAMAPRACLLILILPLVAGCHVVERARKCEKIQGIVREAAPELRKTPILDSPDPKTLRKKARLYGQLAGRIEAVYVKSPTVKGEQTSVVTSLRSLEKHLSDAAQAIVTHEKSKKDLPRNPLARPSPFSGDRPGQAAPLPRSTVHSRQYARSKRALEHSGRTMSTAFKRLEQSCR